MSSYRVWDKKTNTTDKTWGEGARGEFRVGAELERLHEHGFHIFHNWDLGRGNVDHFVVGPTGFFAVETKAWTGNITAENGYFLVRNGRPLKGKGDPVTQARRNAQRVRSLVADSWGVTAYVNPVLCFTKADVAAYSQVRKVEVTTLGSLNRVLADPKFGTLRDKGWEQYSPEQVKAISHCLERTLGVAPAAAPGLPPLEPSKVQRATKWVAAIPIIAAILACFGVLFVASLVFSEFTSEALFDFAYLYRLLGQTVGLTSLYSLRVMLQPASTGTTPYGHPSPMRSFSPISARSTRRNSKDSARRGSRYCQTRSITLPCSSKHLQIRG